MSDQPPDAESRLTSAVKKMLGIGTDAKLKVTGFDESAGLSRQVLQSDSR